jgi:hypothetical protein
MTRIALFALALLISLPAAAQAQTRSRTGARRSAPSTKSTVPTSVIEARTAGAAQVASRIKDLTKFIYLLGGIAKGIEQVDEAARKNEASPTALQTNEQNKTTVKNSLRNVREGLDALEIYFRGTQGLEGYYLKLAGSASGAADAEAQAAAGHFDQAGRTLLGVIGRLTDVLLAMR